MRFSSSNPPSISRPVPLLHRRLADNWSSLVVSQLFTPTFSPMYGEATPAPDKSTAVNIKC